MAPNLSEKEIGLATSPDEAARKSYFSPVNPGSRQGHEVQHWLEAEAQWLAERKLTRTHGFRSQTQNKTNHQTENERITIL
jgi:hypothetical protein